MISAISSQSGGWARSIRTPTHPLLPTYLGTKNRSGSELTRIPWTPLGAFTVIDVWSSATTTNILSRTRKAGEVWPPNGFSVASGNSRQIALIRATADVGPCFRLRSPSGAPISQTKTAAAVTSCASHVRIWSGLGHQVRDDLAQFARFPAIALVGRRAFHPSLGHADVVTLHVENTTGDGRRFGAAEPDHQGGDIARVHRVELLGLLGRRRRNRSGSRSCGSAPPVRWRSR